MAAFQAGASKVGSDDRLAGATSGTDVTITAVAGRAAGRGDAPTIAVTITAPAATTTARADVPVAVVNIITPAATALAAARTGAAAVTVAPLAATAAARADTPTISVIISPPAAVAAARAPTPAVSSSGTSVTITAVPARAAGRADAPTPVITLVLFTGSYGGGEYGVGAYGNGGAIQGQAYAGTPTVTGNVTATACRAAARANPPTISTSGTNATITAVPAIARGASRTGAASVTVAPLPGIAVGRVSAPSVSVVVLAAAARAVGRAPAPTLTGTTLAVTGFPMVIVEIAFTDGPLEPTPTWTDVTTDVLDLTVSRGRQAELGRFDTGTMSARLRNTAAKYDPSNTGSPYYPNVLPMKQIRARAVFGTTTYPLFRGFIEEYQPAVVGSANAEITLDCTDAFAWLANITIAEPLYDEDTSGQRIIDILTDIGWPSALYSARTTANQSIVAEIDQPDGELGVLDGLQDAADSELGDLYVDGAGVLTFRDRRQKLERGGSSTATFGDDVTAELPYTGLDPTYGIATVVNHAVVSLPDWDPSEFEDATSVTAYGRRSSSYDTQLAFPEDADLIAELLVWRGKQPRERFTAMSVKPARVPFSATALWVAALAAEVGTVWTVKHRPPNGSTVTQVSFVQGLTHTIGPGPRWASRFAVAKPDPVITFFKIGDPVYGVIEGPGVIGY